MPNEKKFTFAEFSEIDPVKCHCGFSKRAFVDSPESVASMHVVDIQEDSQVHYHKKMTEIYYVLEGQGQIFLDGELYDLRPGSAVMIHPGCRHHAIGKLRILNVVVPPFDEHDEYLED